MAEWLRDTYLQAVANYTILLKNPVHCSAVDILRMFTGILAAVFLLRLLAHFFAYGQMRRASRPHTEKTSPRLFQAYRSAAARTGIRSLPPLFTTGGTHPLLFAIGIIRRAIFVAPFLEHELPYEELESALAHELIHLKRRDALVTRVMEMFCLAIPLLVIQAFAMSFVYSGTKAHYAVYGSIAAVAFFRMFLWHRILFLRELSCDDLAVRATGDPLTLAASLVHVWRLSMRNGTKPLRRALTVADSFVPFSTPSLETRVRRLIDYRRPALRPLAGRAFRALAWSMLCLALVFLWNYHAGNRLINIALPANTLHDCRTPDMQ